MESERALRSLATERQTVCSDASVNIGQIGFLAPETPRYGRLAGPHSNAHAEPSRCFLFFRLSLALWLSVLPNKCQTDGWIIYIAPLAAFESLAPKV